MFPDQEKIELFARNNYHGWDNWGLEIPDSKINIEVITQNPADDQEGEGTKNRYLLIFF